MVQQNELGKSGVLYLKCMQQWIQFRFFTITENNKKRIHAAKMCFLTSKARVSLR
jgi:hypothetical protein